MAETYSTRIDSKDHDQALAVFKALGLDWSSGIKIYLKQVIKTNSIPFELNNNPDIPNKKTRDAILKAYAEEAGIIPDTSKSFSKGQDAIDYLFNKHSHK